MPARVTPHRLALLVALVAMSSVPAPASAQMASLQLPRVEVRGAVARDGSGGCGGIGSWGFGVGLDVRTRGRWIAAGIADVFLTSGGGCLDIEQIGSYGGSPAAVEDRHRVGPRLGGALGYRFTLGDVPTELTAGMGLVGTLYSAREGDEFAWRVWQGLTFTARIRPGLGLQAEIGRHRLVDRYYVPAALPNGGTYLGDRDRWEPMLRVGLTLPVLR